MLLHPFLTRRFLTSSCRTGPSRFGQFSSVDLLAHARRACWKTKLLHSLLSSLPKYCVENNNLDQSTFPGSCLDIASRFVLCGCERRTLNFEQNEHSGWSDENEFAQGIGIVCLWTVCHPGKLLIDRSRIGAVPIKTSSYENRWSGELRSRPSGLRIYEVVCFLLVQMESPSLDLLDPVKGMCTEVVARLACSYRRISPPSSKMVSTFFSTTGIFTTLQVSWILLKAYWFWLECRTSLWTQASIEMFPGRSENGQEHTVQLGYCCRFHFETLNIM